MTAQFNRNCVATTASLCLISLTLYLSPANVEKSIRSGVRDVARPGQQLVSSLTERLAGLREKFRLSIKSARDQVEFQQKIEDWKLRCRRLQVENGRLRERLKSAKKQGASFPSEEGRRLLVSQLLEATVLGEETAGLWRTGWFLDKGKANGVRESELVLQDESLLIDQGKGAGLAADQPVYAGQSVVGRVKTVGKWSSTIQLVNEAGYRGLAQVGRQTSRGVAFGAEGILEGTSEELCRLRYISSTEAVKEGDAVYTGGRDGVFPYPMYYGEVVRAELPEGAPEWEIWVKPAVGAERIEKVQVFRKRLNPELAQAGESGTE